MSDLIITNIHEKIHLVKAGHMGVLKVLHTAKHHKASSRKWMDLQPEEVPKAEASLIVLEDDVVYSPLPVNTGKQEMI